MHNPWHIFPTEMCYKTHFQWLAGKEGLALAATSDRSLPPAFCLSCAKPPWQFIHTHEVRLEENVDLGSWVLLQILSTSTCEKGAGFRLLAISSVWEDDKEETLGSRSVMIPLLSVCQPARDKQFVVQVLSLYRADPQCHTTAGKEQKQKQLH